MIPNTNVHDNGAWNTMPPVIPRVITINTSSSSRSTTKATCCHSFWIASLCSRSDWRDSLRSSAPDNRLNTRDNCASRGSWTPAAPWHAPWHISWHCPWQDDDDAAEAGVLRWPLDVLITSAILKPEESIVLPLPVLLLPVSLWVGDIPGRKLENDSFAPPRKSWENKICNETS